MKHCNKVKKKELSEKDKLKLQEIEEQKKLRLLRR